MIEDAETGKPVTTCMRGDIRFVAGDLVRADLTLFCTPEGEPVLDGNPEIGENGKPRTAVFRFLVARVEAAGSPAPA